MQNDIMIFFSGKLMSQYTEGGELLPAGRFHGASFRCSRKEECSIGKKQYCFEGGSCQNK